MKIILFLMFSLVALLYTDSCRKDKNDTSNLKPKSTVLPTMSPTPNTENDNDVTIDFNRCAPETKRIDVAFGSTTFEILGKSEKGCLMNYGGEIENPNWDGFLDKSCVIPFSLGKQRFGRTGMGVDFSSLASYCQSVSQPKK